MNGKRPAAYSKRMPKKLVKNLVASLALTCAVLASTILTVSPAAAHPERTVGHGLPSCLSYKKSSGGGLVSITVFSRCQTTQLVGIGVSNLFIDPCLRVEKGSTRTASIEAGWPFYQEHTGFRSCTLATHG